VSDQTEVYPFHRLKKAPGRKSKREDSKRHAYRKAVGKENPKDRNPKDRNPKEGKTEGRKEKGQFKEKGRFTIVKLPVAGKQLLLCLAGFFLGRAVLLGELFPLAVAFAGAAAWIFPASGVLAVIGVSAGLITVVKGVPFVIICVTVVLVWIFLASLPANLKKPLLVIPGIVFALSMILKAGYFAFIDSSSYDYISVVFEAAFAGVFTLVFLNALPSLRKLDELQSMGTEELFCVLVLAAGILAGAGGLEFREVSLQGLLSRLIILVLALVGGMGQGAAAGALMGIIPGLAYVAVPVVIGGYSFAGLVAGICRRLGKPGVATGFLLGSIFLFIYLQNFDHFTTVIIETGLAILFFFMIPMRYIEKLSESLPLIFSGGSADVSPGSRIQAVVNGRMHKWSRIFRELSQGYAQVLCTAAPDFQQEPALQALFSEIGQKVCNGCGVYQICWEREFYLTYQSLLDVFAQVEIYGQVTVGDLPETLKRRCTRARELAITIACLYDTYKLNRYWTRRMIESKEIVSEQLKSVSDIIEGLSAELQFEIEESAGREVMLKEKLKQSGIPVVEVKLSRQKGRKKEVTLSRQPCSDMVDCYSRVVPLVSRFVKEPLSPPTLNCSGSLRDGLCFFRLYPALKYQVNIGVAKTGKGGSMVCGDSHAFVPLRGGEFAFMLSDGMGAGAQAACESSTALSLLEHLLESGLGRELAVKTVNSLMMLRFPGDSFATLDMITLDLYSGQAEFMKIGAPPSFIKRGRRVSLVRANSLPVGIIKDIDVTSVTKKLLPGDLLVMVSDGMLDAYSGPGGKEEWLKEVLQETGEMEPRDLAGLLLQLATTGAGGAAQVPDDMTVLIAKIEKKEDL
jgi:stage II sporulation protein E